MTPATGMSTTGPIAATAARTPVPAGAASEMGLSRTPSIPNSSGRPLNCPKIPPCLAMSSPIKKTIGSRRISSRIASKVASVKLIVRAMLVRAPGSRARHLGEERRERSFLAHGESAVRCFGIAIAFIRAAERFARFGLRGGARECQGIGEFAFRRSPQFFELLLRERRAQPRLQPNDRIVALVRLDFAFGAIAFRIADVVAADAIGLALNERRTVAAPRAFDGLTGGVVHSERVEAVDDLRWYPVSVGANRHVFDLHRLRRLGRGRVVIVLQDKERRKIPDGGEVQVFVEGAAIGRAVAEEADRDLIGLAQPRRERGTGEESETAGDDAVGARHSDRKT